MGKGRKGRIAVEAGTTTGGRRSLKNAGSACGLLLQCLPRKNVCTEVKIDGRKPRIGSQGVMHHIEDRFILQVDP